MCTGSLLGRGGDSGGGPRRDVDAVVGTIIRTARTGDASDGQLLGCPVEHRYNIRSGYREVADERVLVPIVGQVRGDILVSCEHVRVIVAPARSNSPPQSALVHLPSSGERWRGAFFHLEIHRSLSRATSHVWQR